MTRRKVAVLGGSSPFAATLLDELGGGAVEAMTLSLFGRDREALDLLATYGTHRLGSLGWRVTGTADLAAALDGAPGARAAFDGASFSQRREWVTWVTEAKRPETRARRVRGVVEQALARA